MDGELDIDGAMEGSATQVKDSAAISTYESNSISAKSPMVIVKVFHYIYIGVHTREKDREIVLSNW